MSAETADTASTTSTQVSDALAVAHKRLGYGLAGKLLLAFGLIAALTCAGTVISLMQFSNVELVMRKLTDVSMPAVKFSTGIESRANQVVMTSAQVVNITDQTELFQYSDKLAEQIRELWTMLNGLKGVIGETTITRRLETIVAGIDGDASRLSRATNERLTINSQIESSSLDSASANASVSPVLNNIAANGDLSPAVSGALRDLRSTLDTMATALYQAASAKTDVAIAPFRYRFDSNVPALRQAMAVIEANVADPAARQALVGAADSMVRLGTGPNGIFTLQGQEQRANHTIAETQAALDGKGRELRTEVSQLVAQAERESNVAASDSMEILADSRWMLILIAAASLVLAALIVWLFVLRYVAARLTGLSNSMLAIARGNLSAPIPEGNHDEIGDMSRALVVFRDNAREIRHAKEEAEKARAQAEAASRTKSAFLANMSHELRTPLNAIIGYSEILLEDATDRDDQASMSDLKKIQSAGKHLLGLINDILDLSKIEAGRMDVYLEQLFVSKLVEEVKTIVAPTMSRNNNKLIVECPASIGSLRTDHTKLKQSLINLLSNAGKFTKNGDVKLTVTREAGADGVARVSFAVSDSGIGMTEEQLGRLFQAFTQADSSTTRNFGGTGLGLTITKHFITMLGGTISVTSAPDEGSTFTIVLPDQTAQAAASIAVEARATTQLAGGSALTVLVVDDDPTVHDLLGTTLAKEGYTVMHAHDGAEALEIMRKTSPDVVTLDVMMPKVDGWSVLGIMKSEVDLESIPVIMLTIVDDRNLGYSLGASEFMTKPIDRSRLITLLRRFAPRGAISDMVLIVDDDAEVRAMVRHAVGSAGLKSAEAVNGRDALQWLDDNPKPALVLLDLMMPDVDGFEFLTQMRGDDEYRDVPVVVLTAKELTAEERAFLAERTILVLSKGAQPIGSLGSALSAIAHRAPKPALAAAK